MQFTTSLAIAFSAAFGINQEQVQVRLPAPMPEVQTVEEYVQEYFADIPVMTAIAKCESQFRHFSKSGNVLQNSSGSSAIGVFQIMSSIHDPVAEKLGLDLNTLQGNVAYARYLYGKQGTKPWEADKASVACWGKTAVAKAHFAVNK